MSKRERMAEAKAAEQSAAGLAPSAKVVLSLLLLLHVTAVVVAPLQVACDGSPAIGPLRRWLDPYIAALYLNHGYFFFAPNPGPNHLVDYQVEFDDGREVIRGRFPDLATEQPRLLYHRHFMLAESLNNNFAPEAAPPEPSPPPLTASSEEKERHALDKAAHAQMLVEWQKQRKLYEAMRHSVEEHLKAAHGGQRVTLTRVEHRPAGAAEVSVLGKRLNAADLYTNLPENPSGARR